LQLNRKFALEIIKCKLNPIYFINNYVKIEEPGGFVPFTTYGAQQDLVNLIQNEHYVIVLKSRQIGISTIIQAYIVWMMNFHANVVVGVLSRDGSESTDFAKKTMTMIENLPKWMQPKFKKKTEQTFELENKSRLFASQVNLANPQSVFRGKTLTFLVIDEAAFVREIKKAYSGFIPATLRAHQVAEQKQIPYGIAILSTPNMTTGIGEWYYKMWVGALKGHNIYKPMKIHYSQAPFADEEWLEKQKKLLNHDQTAIDQELELKFIASSDAFLEPESYSYLQEIVNNPVDRETLDRTYFNERDGSIIGLGTWSFFKQPDPNKFYLIGVDIASSHGKCNSTIEVFEEDTLEQVAEYSGKCRINDVQDEIKFICSKYKNCLLAPEVNSYGEKLVEDLEKDDEIYDILYKTIKTNNKGKVTSVRCGFETNSKTKPKIAEAVFWTLKEDPSRIKSEKLALELMGLNKLFRGPETDLVMASGICFYIKRFESNKIETSKPLAEEDKNFFDDFFLSDNKHEIDTMQEIFIPGLSF